MTLLFIGSVCLNIYLFVIFKQQTNALDSLRCVTGKDFATISRLEAESKAQAQNIRSNRAYKPKKAPVVIS